MKTSPSQYVQFLYGLQARRNLARVCRIDARVVRAGHDHTTGYFVPFTTCWYGE